MQLVILAGGKGTRLAEILRQPDGTLLPKPLVPVAGIPLLERQITHAISYGVTDVLILVSHKASDIEEFCKNKSNFGINIQFVNDGEPRGTAGALLAALPLLEDTFMVMYGDTLLNVDLHRFIIYFEKHNSDICIFLHPNDHPHDSDIVEVGDSNEVVAFRSYPHSNNADLQNLVNAALYIVSKKTLIYWTGKRLDIDCAKDLFPKLLSDNHKILGYISPEYIKDVGTPARLRNAEHDLRSGRFEAQNLSRKQAAVFLDRDGVINEDIGHIYSPEQFRLLASASKAIQLLNKSGFLVVVVTNQPVVARGECDESGLKVIHNRMEMLLGKDGAYVDRIYYCPHHPHTGFAGERKELKIICKCRKPEIGMLEQAKHDMNIDFSKSWLVGDRASDVQCAHRAGVRSILIQSGKDGRDSICEVEPNYYASDLLSAAKIIISKTKEMI